MKPAVKRTAHLFECPFCLDMLCPVVGSDFDDANQKGRSRLCPNCGPFSTVEVAVLHEGKAVSLAQFGTNKRQQDRDWQRQQRGYQAIGARYTSGTVHVRVKYTPGVKQAYQICWRGHRFTDENTYVAPNGRRGCRACRRYKQAEWKLTHLDSERARQRLASAAQRAKKRAAREAAQHAPGAFVAEDAE